MGKGRSKSTVSLDAFKSFITRKGVTKLYNTQGMLSHIFDFFILLVYVAMI